MTQPLFSQGWQDLFTVFNMVLNVVTLVAVVWGFHNLRLSRRMRDRLANLTDSAVDLATTRTDVLTDAVNTLKDSKEKL